MARSKLPRADGERPRRRRAGGAPELNGASVKTVAAEAVEVLRELTAGVDEIIDALPHEHREDLRRAADVAPYAKKSDPRDRHRRRLADPKRATPDFAAQLDAFVEVAELARAAIGHDDASLFDFEVEALDDLIELTTRLRSRREAARAAALRARQHRELMEIYAKVSAAWPRRYAARTFAQDKIDRSRQQVALEEEGSALRTFVEQYGLSEVDADDLVLDGTMIREKQGADRAAEAMLVWAIEGRETTNAGQLAKSRSFVSGFYEDRARSTLLGTSHPLRALDIDDVGWLWSRILEYRQRAGPTAGTFASLARTVLRLEFLLRKTQQLEAKSAPEVAAKLESLKAHLLDPR